VSVGRRGAAWGAPSGRARAHVRAERAVGSAGVGCALPCVVETGSDVVVDEGCVSGADVVHQRGLEPRDELRLLRLEHLLRDEAPVEARLVVRDLEAPSEARPRAGQPARALETVWADAVSILLCCEPERAAPRCDRRREIRAAGVKARGVLIVHRLREVCISWRESCRGKVRRRFDRSEHLLLIKPCAATRGMRRGFSAQVQLC